MMRTNPGNSGVCWLTFGDVIELLQVKFQQMVKLVEGMGFAIPSNDVVNIINQLEKMEQPRPALEFKWWIYLIWIQLLILN